MARSFIALRSVLYVPGSNQKAMNKAPTLAADAIIFDLEDAVAPATKLAARDATPGCRRCTGQPGDLVHDGNPSRHVTCGGDRLGQPAYPRPGGDAR